MVFNREVGDVAELSIDDVLYADGKVRNETRLNTD